MSCSFSMKNLPRELREFRLLSRSKQDDDLLYYVIYVIACTWLCITF
jgi:hypothetical protein